MSTKPLDQTVSPLLYSEMLQLNSLLPLLDFSSCASTKNICRHSGRWRMCFHASRRVTNIPLATIGQYRCIQCSQRSWMEKLINKSMWKHLENHKLISDRQFGFRAGQSTSDALTYIAQCLSNTISDKEEARVVCLDISKAFDRGWHPGLLVKLCALGFAGKLLHWLADYLKNHSMKVTLNGKSTSTKFINAGVPQGTILEPLLFIILIDDITLDISSTSILYADDVTLMSFIKSKEERIPAAASLKTIAVNKVTNRWRNHNNKATKISELNKIIELYEL